MKNVNVEFWFVCSLKHKYLLEGDREELRIYNRPMVIKIPDVPESEFNEGVPSARLIWYAENCFINAQSQHYPIHDVIGWQAHLGGVDGPAVSHFRIVQQPAS